MTLLQLYRETRKNLSDAGIDSPQTEAAIIIEHYFGCSKSELMLKGDRIQAESGLSKKITDAVGRRCKKYPLQYILGTWKFMDLNLKVGEGVLIPREDTAVLVEAAEKYIRDIQRINSRKGKKPSLTGADLCAGTGAVGLSLCRMFDFVSVTAVEYFDKAYGYLTENLGLYPQCRVDPLKADILSPKTAGKFKELDFIVSNPPYIRREEMLGLQEEVLHEPATALEAGEDGLLFYRAIAKLWMPKIKAGGFIALEIGDTQAEQVCAILRNSGGQDIQVHKDWAGLDRAVTAAM